MKALLTLCLMGLALVASGQNVVQVEYFLDVDAGLGKNTVLTIQTPTADSPLSFTVDVSAASAGYHILYMRTRFGNGSWSHTTMRNVEVIKNQATSNVARVEYFFDTDPGVGKEASVALAIPQPDGAFSFIIPANQTTPGVDSPGAHTLYVRTQDSPSRNWSLTQWKPLTIVNCTPPAQPAAVASQTACAGGTVTYTVPAVASATSYQWAVPPDWTVAGGQGTGTVTLRAPVVTSVTTFTALSVAAVNGCDAGQVRLFSATVNALPPRPAITVRGDTALVSSVASGNQWFLNGTAISGATGQSYRPLAVGQYTVQVTQNGCVSPSSEAYNRIVTAVDDPVVYGIRVFPNPVTDRITIVNSSRNPVRARLYSLTGQQLMTKEDISDTYQFDTAGLPAGCYVVLITDEHRAMRKLIVKQ